MAMSNTQYIKRTRNYIIHIPYLAYEKINSPWNIDVIKIEITLNGANIPIQYSSDATFVASTTTLWCRLGDLRIGFENVFLIEIKNDNITYLCNQNIINEIQDTPVDIFFNNKEAYPDYYDLGWITTSNVNNLYHITYTAYHQLSEQNLIPIYKKTIKTTALGEASEDIIFDFTEPATFSNQYYDITKSDNDTFDLQLNPNLIVAIDSTTDGLKLAKYTNNKYSVDSNISTNVNKDNLLTYVYPTWSTYHTGTTDQQHIKSGLSWHPVFEKGVIVTAQKQVNICPLIRDTDLQNASNVFKSYYDYQIETAKNFTNSLNKTYQDLFNAGCYQTNLNLYHSDQSIWKDVTWYRLDEVSALNNKNRYENMWDGGFGPEKETEYTQYPFFEQYAVSDHEEAVLSNTDIRSFNGQLFPNIPAARKLITLQRKGNTPNALSTIWDGSRSRRFESYGAFAINLSEAVYPVLPLGTTTFENKIISLPNDLTYLYTKKPIITYRNLGDGYMSFFRISPWQYHPDITLTLSEKFDNTQNIKNSITVTACDKSEYLFRRKLWGLSQYSCTLNNSKSLSLITTINTNKNEHAFYGYGQLLVVMANSGITYVNKSNYGVYSQINLKREIVTNNNQIQTVAQSSSEINDQLVVTPITQLDKDQLIGSTVSGILYDGTRSFEKGINYYSNRIKYEFDINDEPELDRGVYVLNINAIGSEYNVAFDVILNNETSMTIRCNTNKDELIVNVQKPIKLKSITISNSEYIKNVGLFRIGDAFKDYDWKTINTNGEHQDILEFNTNDLIKSIVRFKAVICYKENMNCYAKTYNFAALPNASDEKCVGWYYLSKDYKSILTDEDVIKDIPGFNTLKIRK